MCICQEGWPAGLQLLPPQSQPWESLPCREPGNLCQGLSPRQAPGLLPLHPVAMGTSILQLIRAAGRVPFLFILFGACFSFHFLGSQPPLPWGSDGWSRPFVGDELRLQTPEPSDATHVPAALPGPEESASKLRPVA